MYLIINNEKINIKVAKTWYQKLKGLTYKNKITSGLIIPNCISIHTFGMLQNIDLVFFNEKNVILYIFANIPPHKIIQVKEDINKTSVLELPKNTSLNFRIGDVLNFEK